MTISEARPLRQHEVELRMLASRDRAPGLRALAADLAMRQDYDLDAIDDLRLVVDEICAILLADAAPDAVLIIRLLISPNRIEIGASVQLPGSGDLAVKPMSARILSTLADVFDCTTFGDGVDRVLSLIFVRLAAPA